MLGSRPSGGTMIDYDRIKNMKNEPHSYLGEPEMPSDMPQLGLSKSNSFVSSFLNNPTNNTLQRKSSIRAFPMTSSGGTLKRETSQSAF